MDSERKKSDSTSSVASVPIDSVFARAVWDDFFPRLANLAKKKMDKLPRRAVDEEDVALSAINSFFNGFKQGRYEIHDRDDLWRLLSTIAARKAIKHQRQFFAKKRGGGIVQGESVMAANEEIGIRGLQQFQDPNMMPELPEQVFATCEDLLSQLKNEKLRTTALMRMQGFSNQEISNHLNCSLARTKQRIASIKSKWAAALDPND